MAVTPAPPPDEVSVSDVAQFEGNSGTTAFVFAVTRRNFTDATITVQVDTADGTATVADGDYQPVHGLLLTFTPGGPLRQFVTVLVNGDTKVEEGETFNVNLTNVSGAAIGRSGVGTS